MLRFKALRVFGLSVLWSGLSLLFLVLGVVQLASMLSGAVQQPNPMATPTPGIYFELGQKHAVNRSWWSEPAVVELADGSKVRGEEREARLNERILQAVSGPASELPVVDQSTGITLIRLNGQIMATVLPEDLPEYAARMTPEARKALELEVAQSWSYAIENELQLRRWRDSQAYQKGLLGIYACLLFFSLCSHRLISLWSRVFLDSPAWGAKALLWACTVFVALLLLPGGESLGYIFGKGVAGPLFSFLALGVVATLLQHAGSFSLRYYFKSLEQTNRYRDQPRAHSRFAILRHALEFGLRVGLGSLVILGVLVELEFNPATLATGAGLLGASITFVCQDFIRDFLAGLNILVEDQFVLGDTISGGGVEGKVEAFTLRSTQVRCSDGSLVSLPNSELRKVRNQTKDWSQVDFRVTISNRQALAPALESLADELRKLSEEFPEGLLGAPELLGAEELSTSGCSLRATIKTAPGQQWPVKRELNRRVKQRFEREGIEFASPPGLAGA